MTTFVLVHGAWHGAWCWHKVVPLLNKLGHTAIAFDLPGHGIDRTPLADVTLDTYANRVAEVLDDAQEPVVLVGHSLGGFVISHAAELRPQKVKRLVYLAAVLVPDGTVMFDFVKTSNTILHDTGGMIISDDQRSIILRESDIRDKFFHDCSDADVTLAKMVLTPQPIVPFQSALHTTAANWGSLPRHYIECLGDRALPIETQRRCHQQLSCEKVFTMTTSHSPFFSAPRELTEHLVV